MNYFFEVMRAPEGKHFMECLQYIMKLEMYTDALYGDSEYRECAFAACLARAFRDGILYSEDKIEEKKDKK